MRRGPTALAFSVSLAWCVISETAVAQKPSAEQVLKDGSVDWQIDPPPPIKWPLEVGKFGTLFNAVMHSRESPSGIPVRLTWEVKAYESVQVAAGTYQAFRIVYLAEYIGDPLRRSGGIPGRQYWNVIMWYALEARQIVKAEGAGLGLDFQLVAAEGAAPAPLPAAALQVAISSPRDQARVDQESIALAGLASSGKGVKRVLVMLNGVEVSRLEERAPSRTLPVNLPLKLRDGQNTIVVTATDV